MEPRRKASVWGLDASSYVRHALHAESCVWVEKNCYVDLWIELLHAAKLEPLAMLPFTLASDFDGEQWTFYKPPHSELRALYGVDVQEMNVFKPLVEHLLFHASQGRLVMTEADAFWLPDTRGTDYRAQHTKTTIAVDRLDLDTGKLGYFHNAGYYELEGEDFTNLLRLDRGPDPTFLPLFAELAGFSSAPLSGKALAEKSRELLSGWVAAAPATNPIARFGTHLSDELTTLRSRGLGYYHTFAFATIRQCGSGFELAAAYLRWLEAELSGSGYAAAATAFDSISASAKALILKGARAVSSTKPVDFAPMFSEMSASWDAGMLALGRLK